MNNSNCVQLNLPDAEGKYVWGDSTIVHGFYLGVLATEYALFKKLGLPTKETEEDLYFALKAFNRLDEQAEVNYGLPPKLDGFYQRGDVPPDFVFLPDGSYRFPRSEPNINGYGCISSPTACGFQSIEDGFYVSQDQTIGMLFGLALIAKLVPDSVSYNGIALRQEGRAIAHRIVMSLRENKWMVTDPLGNHPPDKWGGYAIGFSDQIAKSANYICAPDFGVKDYRNPLSYMVGVPIWKGFEASWPFQTYVNRSMALKLVSITNEWSPDKLALRSSDFGSIMFTLAHAILQDLPVSKYISLWEIESLLSLAPCSGPCDSTPNCENAIRWRGDNVWQNPESRNGSRHYPRGEYHGLDYLLLHNIYFLYKNGTYTVSPPKIPQSGCENYSGLDTIIKNGPKNGQKYDPFQECAAIDLNKYFCGRSFASWLDDAYSGKITIFTGQGKWKCTGYSPCVISMVSSTGTEGPDLILGTYFNDNLKGGQSNDCIYGFDGNDIIEGGAGRDEIYGGKGNDKLYGDIINNPSIGDNDLIVGGEGDDEIYGGSSLNDLFGEEGNDKIYGGEGDEFIEGGNGNDYIKAYSGIDIIRGGDGDDEIHGDLGDDFINGGEGRDKLEGGEGNDTFFGGKGDDFIKGDAGNDTIWADEGNDRLCGGKGSDFLGCDWGENEYEVEEDPIPGTEDTISWGCIIPITSDKCSDEAFLAW